MYVDPWLIPHEEIFDVPPLDRVIEMPNFQDSHLTNRPSSDLVGTRRIPKKWTESGRQTLPRLGDRYSTTIAEDTFSALRTTWFLFGGFVLEAAEEIPRIYRDLTWPFEHTPSYRPEAWSHRHPLEARRKYTSPSVTLNYPRPGPCHETTRFRLARPERAFF